MDAGAVGPWSFGTARELLFGEREQRQPAPFGTCRGRRPHSALAPIQQPPPLPRTTTEPGARAGVRASAVWRHAGAAIKCRPQAAAGGHCSKLGRQIAVNLKADAHFDKCRSCP
jgi:hypothetical protein